MWLGVPARVFDGDCVTVRVCVVGRVAVFVRVDPGVPLRVCVVGRVAVFVRVDPGVPVRAWVVEGTLERVREAVQLGEAGCVEVCDDNAHVGEPDSAGVGVAAAVGNAVREGLPVCDMDAAELVALGVVVMVTGAVGNGVRDELPVAVPVTAVPVPLGEGVAVAAGVGYADREADGVPVVAPVGDAVAGGDCVGDLVGVLIWEDVKVGVGGVCGSQLKEVNEHPHSDKIAVLTVVSL